MTNQNSIFSATDLSIRCLEQSDQLDGIVIATCCHHKCNWSNFQSKESLPVQFRDESSFRILCLLSSWRTCGFHRTADTGTDLNDSELNRFKLTVEEKENIGSKAKFIIDKGTYITNTIKGRVAALQKGRSAALPILVRAA